MKKQRRTGYNTESSVKAKKRVQGAVCSNERGKGQKLFEHELHCAIFIFAGLPTY